MTSSSAKVWVTLGNYIILSNSAFSKEKSGIPINEEFAQSVLTNAQIRYDKGGDEHYNIISAFIKSIRGSDPQAAVLLSRTA